MAIDVAWWTGKQKGYSMDAAVVDVVKSINRGAFRADGLLPSCHDVIFF